LVNRQTDKYSAVISTELQDEILNCDQTLTAVVYCKIQKPRSRIFFGEEIERTKNKKGASGAPLELNTRISF